MASFMSFHGGATTWKNQTYTISRPHLSRRILPSLAVPKSQPVISLKISPGKTPRKKLRSSGWEQLMRRRGSAQIPVINATSGESSTSLHDGSENPQVLLIVATMILFLTWNMLIFLFWSHTQHVYAFFRFPFFVSAFQLLVSVTLCSITWLFGFHKPAPLNMELLKALTPIAAAHAIGITMSNFCMVSVGGSPANIIKALEPLFTAVASQIVLGYQIPLSLWLSVATVVIGVILTLTKHSFNWLGFISSMMFTIAFTYRNIYSKKAMKSLDSTSLYAYTSLIALYFCVPLAIIIEGPKFMQYGFKDAIAKFGMGRFTYQLLVMGIFYHITSMVAIKTLEWLDPLTLAVGNISHGLFLICSSIMLFEINEIGVSTRMVIGTLMGMCGIIRYSKGRFNLEKEKKDFAKKYIR